LAWPVSVALTLEKRILEAPATPSASSAGSSGGQQNTQNQDALTDAERAAAIGEVRGYAAMQYEAVTAMLDGVLLGAEQVQNKRLDLLETGPEDTSPVVPLVSMIVTIILEGTIGPAIATVITEKILKQVFKGLARAIKRQPGPGRLFNEVRLIRDKAQVASLRSAVPGLKRRERRGFSNLANELEKHAQTLEQAAKVSWSEARSMTTTWRTASESISENIVAGVKAVREQQESLRPSEPGVGDNDDADTTAGVSVLSTAMAEAATLRLAISAATEGNIMVLRQTNSTIDDAKSIIADCRPETFDLASMRDAFALLSEGLIWAKQLSLDVKTDKITRQAVLDNSITGKAANETLRKYLRARFGKAAQVWLAKEGIVDRREPGLPKGPPSAGTPLPPPSALMPRGLGAPDAGAMPMPGGGFGGGPQDAPVKSPGLDLQQDVLVQLYLGALGQKGTAFMKQMP
jgi:hypothetical protein